MIDWRHWHNEPFLVGGLVVAGWLYALLVGPLRGLIAPPGTPFPRRAVAFFSTSLLLFYLAVGSPLDQIGERFLFSAHMIQHQIMIYPAAVCFLLGLPGWMVDAFARQPVVGPVGRLLTRPLIAGPIYVITLSLWHVPALYDWALQDKLVHVIEHLMFFGAALLLWWPLLGPGTAWPRARPGTQMLYVFLVTVGMTPVFAFITFSEEILYPTYEYAPRIVNLSPREDQVLGGTLMKLGGLAASLAAFAWSFAQWYRESETAAGDRRAPRRGRGRRPQ
jgi:putative membrane protein